MPLHWRASALLVKNSVSFGRLRDKSGILNRVRKKFHKIVNYALNTFLGSEIDVRAQIEPDLLLPHPTGVVIHEDAVIGVKCIIHQQVTVGRLADGAVPIIGDGVFIGSGAKILGGIRIGNNVRIGANAVVLKSIPDNATAVGVPARIKITQFA
jgi:serine O-acetyltransferase